MVTPFYPPDLGGIAVHVWKLTEHLVKKNNVQIITCTQVRPEIMLGNPLILKIPSINPPPIPYRSLTSFRIPVKISLAIDAIDTFNPDIIHLHGHHYLINWIIAIHPRFEKTPKVLTMHGMYALNPNVQGGRTLIEDIFNQTILRLFLNKLDNIIALTRTIAKYAEKYTKTPISIIPNGIDIDKYLLNLNRKFEYREKYNLPQDNIIVLFSGRLTYVKGILEFISAIKMLLKERKDIYFLIVGSGPLESKVKKMLLRIRNTRMMSWTPPELIHELYIASDIYVLPSKWEALPITILEAMVANLVIVATKVGGVPDVLEPYHKKILIANSNPKEIKKGILKALELVQEKRHMESIIDYIRQFDWSEVARKVIEVYNCVIKRKK